MSRQTRRPALSLRTGGAGRQQASRLRLGPLNRRLGLELLEDRRLLALVTVTNSLDVARWPITAAQRRRTPSCQAVPRSTPAIRRRWWAWGMCRPSISAGLRFRALQGPELTSGRLSWRRPRRTSTATATWTARTFWRGSGGLGQRAWRRLGPMATPMGTATWMGPTWASGKRSLGSRRLLAPRRRRQELR